MPETARWFELLDDVGVEPAQLADPETGEPVDNPKAGELQPMKVTGLTIAIPTKVVNIGAEGPGILLQQQSVLIEPIPGTRMTKVTDPLIANALATHGCFREIDPPKQKDLANARKDTQAARERAEEN